MNLFGLACECVQCTDFNSNPISATLGVWKQVVQDATPESASSNDHYQTTASAAGTSPVDTNASLIPAYISTDPIALSYYNMYYQQALGTGQDMATASATALAAYTAWASYAASATAATAVASDASASSKYSPAYNSVPPPNQIMAGTTVATSTTVPSTAYGYAMPTTAMAPNSNYSAAYAAYYGYGAVNAQPPPPPE